VFNVLITIIVQALALTLSSLLALGSLFAHMGAKVEEQEGAGISMLQSSVIAEQLSQRIVKDERHLSRDLSRQQNFLRSIESNGQKIMLTTYADGCKCSCPPSGCDEEKHEGPVHLINDLFFLRVSQL
jgi:hypothetical protein